jgi:hypothetical protein
LTTPQPKFAPKGLCGTDGHRAEVDFLVRYNDLMTSDDDADHALHTFLKMPSVMPNSPYRTEISSPEALTAVIALDTLGTF